MKILSCKRGGQIGVSVLRVNGMNCKGPYFVDKQSIPRSSILENQSLVDLDYY